MQAVPHSWDAEKIESLLTKKTFFCEFDLVFFLRFKQLSRNFFFRQYLHFSTTLQVSKFLHFIFYFMVLLFSEQWITNLCMQRVKKKKNIILKSQLINYFFCAFSPFHIHSLHCLRLETTSTAVRLCWFLVLTMVFIFIFILLSYIVSINKHHFSFVDRLFFYKFINLNYSIACYRTHCVSFCYTSIPSIETLLLRMWVFMLFY